MRDNIDHEYNKDCLRIQWYHKWTNSIFGDQKYVMIVFAWFVVYLKSIR